MTYLNRELKWENATDLGTETVGNTFRKEGMENVGVCVCGESKNSPLDSSKKEGGGLWRVNSE